MSDFKTIWTILWTRAAARPGPFEISEVAPEVAQRLKISAQEAQKRTGELLKELERLPEGEQFFAREGNAVVPLAEFESADGTAAGAENAYPFEI